MEESLNAFYEALEVMKDCVFLPLDASRRQRHDDPAGYAVRSRMLALITLEHRRTQSGNVNVEAVWGGGLTDRNLEQSQDGGEDESGLLGGEDAVFRERHVFRSKAVTSKPREDVYEALVDKHGAVDDRPQVKESGHVELRLQLGDIWRRCRGREENIEQAYHSESVVLERHAEIWQELVQHGGDFFWIKEQLGESAYFGQCAPVALAGEGVLCGKVGRQDEDLELLVQRFPVEYQVFCRA